MTDKNELEGQSRRKFLKTTGAVGVAATGVGAFGGSAAAQETANLDIQSVSRSIFRQTGRQGAAGLIVVQVQNVAVDVIDNVNVQIADVADVDVGDINVLNNNTVKIAIDEVVEVTQNQVQVAVTLLGETVQGADFEGTTTETFNVGQ